MRGKCSTCRGIGAARPWVCERLWGEVRHGNAPVPVKCTPAAAIVALVASVLAMPVFGAKKAETVLLCTNPVSGASWQIKIDFEAGTVDSNPARISSSEISWRDAADTGHYTLDRKTGNLTVVFASSTGGYFIHDHCTVRD